MAKKTMHRRESELTQKILSLEEMKGFSDKAWSREMCLAFVKYVPNEFLEYYISTSGGWTEEWMNAVADELSDRALLNYEHKPLPKTKRSKRNVRL